MLPSTSRPRILVVDDDPAVRELLTTRLALAGYLTYQARDGQEAVQAVYSWRPTAMILDINMPVLDGFGVLEKLQAGGGLRGLRVMVLTARNQGPDVRRALDLGALDFLAKPFDDAHFLARTRRLLRGAEVKALG
jgi:two-component system OmpR family response regulator